ncbi:MAG: transglycosylase SLT domain-containing protein [Bacteroidota bacterium]|nr:transglycosylase SLT domain-containing protein [Bacteroidota bacterium]MDP3146411.1 transglycosylase SLT domain-containing protein [Bacteroidota bacterium]
MISKKILLKFFSQLNLASLTVVFFVSLVLLFSFFKIFIIPPSTNLVSYTNNNQIVLGLNIPSNLEFCGEKIPLNSLSIKEDLEKEFFNNNYWKHNSAVLFAKAQKWFPYIEPILKQQGVPDDFKYVAVIESHLSNIVSPAGAAGFWQLMPSSARNYDLEVNEMVDERLDVEKATRAACRHLKDAYAVFNNWTLSAAAYNLGIGGIQAALKKQKSNNYYDLLLNSETGSFVYRILAYKTLFSNPTHFGIKKKKWNYFAKIPLKTYKVDSSITNISYLAKQIGCSKTIIKLYNPWLLGETLNNPENKIYEFKIPKNLKKDYSTYILDLIGENGAPFEENGKETQVKSQISDSVKTQ